MTHVIFAHPHHDPAAADFAAAAAAFCRPGDHVARVDEGIYAPKGSPDATYLAAFTDFDLPAFVRLVQSVPWESPWATAAFVRRPGHTRFESVDLRMAFDVGRDRKLAAAFGWNLDLPDQQTEFLAKTYAGVLDRRRERVEDSLRNPCHHFDGYDVLASVSTETPWAFECVQLYPERGCTESTRREFGPGKDDWEWVTVKHRTIYADLAFRGVYVQLACDVAEVGTDVFEQVRSAARGIQPGDWVRVDGEVDVRSGGECVIERVRRVERVAREVDR